MTSPQDAPGDTGVERAWAEYSSIIGLARLDKVNGGLDAIGFLHESDRAKAIVEAAVRAQIDEDVRRLVAAARLADDHIWCECVLQPPPHEDILCKPHKALRAALEPFKAVAPTGSEEVNGNG